MKIFKRISGLLVIVFGIFLFGFYVKDVAAISFSENPTKLYFKNYGISNNYKDTAFTRVKYIDGKLAYCIQSKRKVGEDYKRYDFQDVNRAKVAGQIIYLINSDNSITDSTKRYMFVDAALNTYFASEGYKTSVKYADSNGYINKIVANAKSYINTMVTSISRPKVVNSSISARQLGSNGSVSISEQITFNNLVTQFNGQAVSYTISATANNGGTAEICSGVSGTGCSTSRTVTGTSVSFYVKVSGYDAAKGSSVKVIIESGSYSYNIPMAARYVAVEDGDANGSHQILVVPENTTKNVSTSNSVYFDVYPTTEDIQHNITLYKTNDDGNTLSGAKFILNGGKFWNNVEGKENPNGVFRWNTGYTLIGGVKDDFYGTELTITETSAPDGYIKIDEYKFTPAISGSSCYDEEGNKVEDLNYCYAHKYNKACREGFTYNEEKNICEKEVNEFQIDENKNSSTGYLKDFENGYYADEYVFDKTTGKFSLTNLNSLNGLDGEGIKGLEGKFICSEVDTENGIVCKGILYQVSSVVFNEEDDSYNFNLLEYSASQLESEIDDVVCNFNGDIIEESCDNLYAKYTYVSSNSGNISINMHNARNSVKISKQTVLGDKAKEVSGASLKICTEKEYKVDGKKCVAASTVDGLEMSWTSSSVPVEWRGLKVGNYYIIETTPPTGYVLVDAVTKFSIDEKGIVKTGDTVVKDNVIVINNQLNELSISKTDIATGKELPGAELSICIAIKNKDGEYEMPVAIDGDCLITNYYDGIPASWVSTDKPKEIKGLPSGSYYLVEKIAPEGYTTAESILFTVKDDGTITDKDGKEIKDKKIVMKDKAIEDVKTGQLPMIIVAVILMASIGAIVYYGMKNNNDDNGGNTNNKLSEKKLHNV